MVLVALRPVLLAANRYTGVIGTAESIGMTLALLMAHGIMLAIDKRGWSYAWLGREAARPVHFAAGFGLGAAPIGVSAGLLLAIGWLVVQPQPDGSWLDAAMKVSLALLPAAFYEELLSRGYVFAALSEWLGRVVAIALTSIAFGLLHLWNPGWTVGSIASVVVAGVFLAGVLLATGSMYAAWMAHFAWNWVMAVPLHIQVSGLTLATPDYRTVDAGPDWATGGRWGPEGGAFAVGAMILALVLLYLMGSGKWALGARRSTPESRAESPEPTAESQ